MGIYPIPSLSDRHSEQLLLNPFVCFAPEVRETGYVAPVRKAAEGRL